LLISVDEALGVALIVTEVFMAILPVIVRCA